MNLSNRTLYLPDEASTLAVGRLFGETLKGGATVYLEGSLGAGKTTFCKGIIVSFGYSGLVKSPTYTLVEPYAVNGKQIYHFDLYRLGEPEELEFMGIRDYFLPENICLVEWPEKGADYLAPADIIVELTPQEAGRALSLVANSIRGNEMLVELNVG